MKRSNNVFDYIVVGAGSAGSVVAARLSEDPDVKVAVVEAGPMDRHFGIHLPPGFVRLFKTKYDWAYETEPEEGCKGRKMFWPRGKVVGGSGSLNAQLYIRGHRQDYDDWRDRYGCEGWGYDDVLPYFKRSENQTRTSDIDSRFHGSDGPWNVEDRFDDLTVLTPRFVEAGAELGWTRNDDFNGAHQEGVGTLQVNQKGGKRLSPARAFLHPALKRPNLTLFAHTQVTHLRIDGGGVQGVEARRKGKGLALFSEREVILCGGAVNSPQLMLISGLGPADELEKQGVRVWQDLPRVGKGLQDHLVVSTIFRSREDVGLDHAENLRNLIRWIFTKRGPLTTTVCEGSAFVRTREGLAQPDLQMHFLPAALVNHGFDEATDQGFNFGPTLIKPLSRGQVTLRSSDPLAPAKIEPNYLAERQDVDLLIEGVKVARRLANTKAFAEHLDREVRPGPDAKTDADLEAFVRETAETIYHPTSTCAMGTDPAISVVDPQLRVHGVEGLRVVDASVMPEVPGGNTNAPTVMVAEKGSDLIRGL